MTLRSWLILFVISMAVNAEVLTWAISHGQFTHVNRGCRMALRSDPAAVAPTSARRRRWPVAAIFIGLAAMVLVWLNGMVQLALAALSRFGTVHFPY